MREEIREVWSSGGRGVASYYVSHSRSTIYVVRLHAAPQICTVHWAGRRSKVIRVVTRGNRLDFTKMKYYLPITGVFYSEESAIKPCF